jgi:hypothetical protein
MPAKTIPIDGVRIAPIFQLDIFGSARISARRISVAFRKPSAHNLSTNPAPLFWVVLRAFITTCRIHPNSPNSLHGTAVLGKDAKFPEKSDVSKLDDLLILARGVDRCATGNFSCAV